MRNGCSDHLCHLPNDTGFLEAMEFYRGQIGEELGPYGDDELDAQLKEDAKKMNAAADIAIALYKEHGEAAGEIMRTFATDNEWIALIGEACVSGNWSVVAI